MHDSNRRTIASLAILLAVLLTGCAVKPPADQNNICSIFREKSGWHDSALAMQERWNVPLHVPMAFMQQESSFRSDALPPRRYVLGFIPWGRVSSAYGYSQAKTETWSDYRKETGNWGADRDDFADAMDFMGWYISKTRKVNGVSVTNAPAQYLNYHEGWGGYRKRSYEQKPWLKTVAGRVGSRAEKYGQQYQGCRQSLPDNFFERLFSS
jgi:hypothetical protein